MQAVLQCWYSSVNAEMKEHPASIRTGTPSAARSPQALRGPCTSSGGAQNSPGAQNEKEGPWVYLSVWVLFLLPSFSAQICATNPLPYPYCPYLLVNLYLSFKIQAKEFKLILVSIEVLKDFSAGIWCDESCLLRGGNCYLCIAERTSYKNLGTKWWETRLRQWQ